MNHNRISLTELQIFSQVQPFCFTKKGYNIYFIYLCFIYIFRKISFIYRYNFNKKYKRFIYKYNYVYELFTYDF